MTVVIIGGGHNGLAAAFYLAKAGLKPIVLESRSTCGGGAITSELAQGFLCPVLSHHTPLASSVARDMALERYGLQILRSDVDTFAPSIDGGPLVTYRDTARAAESIRTLSAPDASTYPAYRTVIEQVGGVVASLLQSPPPDIDRPGMNDLWNLLKTGRRFRALDRKTRYRLLRWGPMPVADLAREWFESELLCASIAGPAVSGTMLAPRSAGSGLVLLLHEAARRLAGGSWQARGGPGALTQAMAAAAAAAGAEIRTSTRVEQIVVSNDRVTAVIAGNQRLPADAVVSAVDPKTTFLRLMDSSDLAPDFLVKMRNYRSTGAVAKVNLALGAMPAFDVAPEMLGGRIHIGPHLDYLEHAFDHAKYGEMSAKPWLDVTMPSILDSGLAPAGAHVMSIYVHYAPYRLRHGEWAATTQPLLRTVLDTLEQCAPGIASLVVGAQVITPADRACVPRMPQQRPHRHDLIERELAVEDVAARKTIL